MVFRARLPSPRRSAPRTRRIGFHLCTYNHAGHPPPGLTVLGIARDWNMPIPPQDRRCQWPHFVRVMPLVQASDRPGAASGVALTRRMDAGGLARPNAALRRRPGRQRVIMLYQSMKALTPGARPVVTRACVEHGEGVTGFAAARVRWSRARIAILPAPRLGPAKRLICDQRRPSRVHDESAGDAEELKAAAGRCRGAPWARITEASLRDGARRLARF